MPCGDNPEEGILQPVSHFGRHLDDDADDGDACDDDRDDDGDNSREEILQPVSLSPTLSDDLMITTSNTSLIPPLTEDGDGILI